ncbi:hypothetical protein DEU56DRAFT_916704 [Suillus clintonianus]|uniref:uncharacterized protein n=1 Tax=Suillus clintonianus TaxID=1904413 RepID=UPI001B862A79|nr:uncharacterized protein DEU56DRAFT_916704 [Suillus clintonianus]KAG2125096.1 hypothetical protein DEU56DRAFT_916704 [Suillus clintonianus]
MQLPAAPTACPIYTYVQTVNQVLRFLPISNEEPFHGLSGRFLFMGYVGHAHQLSPIYWPEEYINLARPPHDILRNVGFLLIVNDNTRFSIYEIEAGGCAFLNDYRTNFCAPNLHGSVSPIWLPVFSSPQQHTHTDSLLLPLLHPSISRLGRLIPSVVALSGRVFSDDVPPNARFWIRAYSHRTNLRIRRSVRRSLPTQISFGDTLPEAIHSTKAKTPDNPFFVPAAVSRRLITTSFLRALHFNQKTYDELSSEPLTIMNDNGTGTVVGWSYLRNRFLDFYIDVTSELRKITRGSTSPLAGFAVNEDQKMGKIFDLIVAFNSADRQQVQEAICVLIGTQAFKEVLWAALLRPIAELAEGNARLADLYPDAIQTWTGYLRKGIVGVLITLMYQAFTLQIPSDSANLKVPELHPIIMAALDAMYMDPDRFTAFFQVARELPSLQETNVLVMDPKNKVPKYMTDEMGVRRMKTLNDLGPIDVVFTSDLEVPNAQFIFPVPSSEVELHISYFTSS